jgi:hypothetical protein
MADAGRPPSVGVMQSATMQVIRSRFVMTRPAAAVMILSAARAVAGPGPTTRSLAGLSAEIRGTQAQARP